MCTGQSESDGNNPGPQVNEEFKDNLENLIYERTMEIETAVALKADSNSLIESSEAKYQGRLDALDHIGNDLLQNATYKEDLRTELERLQTRYQKDAERITGSRPEDISNRAYNIGRSTGYIEVQSLLNRS